MSNSEAVQCHEEGLRLFKHGKPNKSISQLREAVRLDPQFAEAHVDLGMVLSNTRQMESAVREYQEALRLGFEYATVYNQLGYALRKLGRLDESITASRKAISLNTKDADAYYTLWWAYYEKRDYNSAVDVAQQAVSLGIHLVHAHQMLGHIYALQDRYDEAIQEFDASLRLDPKQPRIRLKRNIAAWTGGAIRWVTLVGDRWEAKATSKANTDCQ